MYKAFAVLAIVVSVAACLFAALAKLAIAAGL